MNESPFQYAGSPLQLMSRLMPFAVSEERHRELLEAVRLFPLKQDEKVSLRPGDGRDCLQLVSGEASIRFDGREPMPLVPEEGRACQLLAPDNTRVIEVSAHRQSLLCHIDVEKLEFLTLWEELSRSIDDDPSLQRRMQGMRDSLAFRKLPPEVVQQAVQRMQPVDVEAGEEIVRQYDQGDAFYVIEEGSAEVWRGEFPGDDPELIVTLGSGDSFGEEALVTGKQRSATVRMVTAGRLLRLDEADFKELVSTSLIREVDPEQGRDLLAQGYRLLDVRWEEEFDESYIPNAQLLPLGWLRERTDELDSAAKYLIYCRSGKRSAVAALVLSQHGIESVSMRGGILAWPYETESNLPSPPPKRAPA